MADSELLQIKGVGQVTAARLGDAGVSSIAAVAAATLDRLVEVTRFPPARATVIRQAAAQLVPASPAPAAARSKVGSGGETGPSKKPKGTKGGGKKKKKKKAGRSEGKNRPGASGKDKSKSKKKGKGKKGKKDKKEEGGKKREKGKKGGKNKRGKKGKGKKKG